jgi:hypothetical protein
VLFWRRTDTGAMDPEEPAELEKEEEMKLFEERTD